MADSLGLGGERCTGEGLGPQPGLRRDLCRFRGRRVSILADPVR